MATTPKRKRINKLDIEFVKSLKWEKGVPLLKRGGTVVWQNFLKESNSGDSVELNGFYTRSLLNAAKILGYEVSHTVIDPDKDLHRVWIIKRA